MNTPHRYTVRSVVNDLIDALMSEGVSRKDIRELLEDTTDADREYFDIEWLFSED